MALSSVAIISLIQYVSVKHGMKKLSDILMRFFSLLSENILGKYNVLHHDSILVYKTENRKLIEDLYMN